MFLSGTQSHRARASPSSVFPLPAPPPVSQPSPGRSAAPRARRAARPFWLCEPWLRPRAPSRGAMSTARRRSWRRRARLAWRPRLWTRKARKSTRTSRNTWPQRPGTSTTTSRCVHYGPLRGGCVTRGRRARPERGACVGGVGSRLCGVSNPKCCLPRPAVAQASEELESRRRRRRGVVRPRRQNVPGQQVPQRRLRKVRTPTSAAAAPAPHAPAALTHLLRPSAAAR